MFTEATLVISGIIILVAIAIVTVVYIVRKLKERHDDDAGNE